MLPGVGEEGHQQDGEPSEQQQRRQEVLSLQARRSELEMRLIAARSALSSAVERKEFMEEEVEQASDDISVSKKQRWTISTGVINLSYENRVCTTKTSA